MEIKLDFFAFSNADLVEGFPNFYLSITLISSLPSLFINKLRRKLIVLKRREPKKAGQKPMIIKPLTILETM